MKKQKASQGRLMDKAELHDQTTAAERAGRPAATALPGVPEGAAGQDAGARAAGCDAEYHGARL